MTSVTVGIGDRIPAGSSEFVLDGPTPIFADVTPTLSAAARPADAGTLTAALTLALGGIDRGKLYAIVDGAQSLPLAFTARLMGHELYTVFSGDLATTVAHAGPLLVRFDERSGFLGKWVEHIGTHAGVLFEAPADLSDVLIHLRRIFIATDEEAQEYFFRFYDPRVIRTFLPTCHPNELKEFFGPITQWIVETEDAAGYSSYRFAEDNLSNALCAGIAATPQA